MSVYDPPSLSRAVAAYQQAVALDPSFSQAWAQLARAQAVLYYSGVPTPARAEAARQAATRAVSLSSARPEGHLALALYSHYVLKDNHRALAEDSIALALAPGNAEVLGALGWDELTLGRWEAARSHMEQGARLDPRSVSAAEGFGFLLLLTRRYPEAARALDRAMQIAPSNLLVREERAMVALAQGDLAGARTVIRAAPKEVDPTALVAFVANYSDLAWVLDEEQQRLLLRLAPSAFDVDGSRAAWGLVLAQTYSLHGDTLKARAYADSARIAYEQELPAAPQVGQQHVLLGLALAYLGRKEDAIREGQRGVSLLPLANDALHGAYLQHQLARIYLIVGDHERALDTLEPLLRVPYYLSPGWLRIDPTFTSLRGNPRFERLARGE
jgi:serine/threonine-protein kinase